MRIILALSLLVGGALAVLAQPFQPSDSPDVTVTVEGTAQPVVLTDPYSFYQPSGSPYWAQENPWNLVEGAFNGPDGPFGTFPPPYSESVTVNPSTFPGGTVVEFSFSSTFSGAYSYSGIVWGSSFGGFWPSPNGVTPTPTQVDSINTLIGTFDLSLTSNPDNYAVLWETFFTNEPNNGLPALGPHSCEPNGVATDRCVGLELMIYLHFGPGGAAFQLATHPNHYIYTSPDGNFSAYIIDVGWGFTDNNGTQFHPGIIVLPMVVANGGDFLSATIDLKALLQNIRDHGFGYLKGSDYLDGWSMGIETNQNSGTFTINNLSYTLN